MIQLMVRSYNQMIGLARYTMSLQQALDTSDITYKLITPSYPWLVRLGHRSLSRFGYDVKTFFTTYPVAAGSFDGNSLTHLTTQQMAIILWFQPRICPVVVTVHDIVPFLVRSDLNQTTYRHPMDALFDNWALKGLRHADVLISVSKYTKQTMIAALNIPEDKVEVIYEGVDHQMFRPITLDNQFYKRYELKPDLRYILYVGSENPRKNLPRLLEAFRKIHQKFPDTRLIKIGSAEYTQQAEQLRQQIQALDLQDAVLFVEHVPDEDLARFYNLATLFIFPSLMEGFGLPPLEAMACGAPVICSNTASLPEVAGDAAILVDPTDVEQIAQAMWLVLSQPDVAAALREKGLARAARFTWERTARETIAVYERVLAERK